MTEVVDVPRPKVKGGCLLIQSQRSLVSSGTERMLLDFSKSSLLSKAKKQPENVKRVLDKIKTDGIIETFDTVNTKGSIKAGSLVTYQPKNKEDPNYGMIAQVKKVTAPITNVEAVRMGGPRRPDPEKMFFDIPNFLMRTLF